MPSPTVLVVDDEPLVRWTLTERLGAEGYQVREAASASEALQHVDAGVDLVLLDYRLPDGDGLGVLTRIRAVAPDALVILLTAHVSVGTAVEAMRAGAYHYLNKPFDVDEVAVLVQKALETTELKRELRALRASQGGPYGVDRIIGNAESIAALRTLVTKVARGPATTVLVTGESGTGKDLAARVIHDESPRAKRPFMNITCSALPESLLESELFGHERGAFTGADRQKRGLFEIADGGTLYLDEIGEMVPALQAKLLRFLEEKTFRRVGGSADIRVDVRVVAATNRRLEREVKEGRFREDLYYRLNVVQIVMPPLRERAADVSLLARYYVDRFNTEFRKSIRRVTPPAVKRLTDYAWPGNVRELRNAVERAMLLADGDELGPEHFPLGGAAEARLTETIPLPPKGVALDALERSLVVQALERCQWNQTKAAALLGLNRDQIRYRIEKFKLVRPG